jgi:hypothetical protein
VADVCEEEQVGVAQGTSMEFVVAEEASMRAVPSPIQAKQSATATVSKTNDARRRDTVVMLCRALLK